MKTYKDCIHYVMYNPPLSLSHYETEHGLLPSKDGQCLIDKKKCNGLCENFSDKESAEFMIFDDLEEE